MILIVHDFYKAFGKYLGDIFQLFTGMAAGTMYVML